MSETPLRPDLWSRARSFPWRWVAVGTIVAVAIIAASPLPLLLAALLLVDLVEDRVGGWLK